jgi:hypothetical protein
MAEDFDADALRGAAREGRIQWHQHAFERLLERGITRAEAVGAIISGEVIEVYPEDRPYPSCLILHTAAEPLHVVAAADPDARVCHVITAYRPDLEHFEPDFKTRKKEA